MSIFIQEFTKINKPQFLKYKDYIDGNDWTITKPVLGKNKGKKKVEDEEISYKILADELKQREEESLLQYNLVDGILNKLIYFTTEAKADASLIAYKSFVKYGLDIVNTHINRADTYNGDVDIALIPFSSLRSDEIAFHNTLFKQTAKLAKNISSLNFNEDEEEFDKLKIRFHEDRKAPLIMREPLSLIREDIREKTKSIPVDWSLRTSKEMFINMRPQDIPKWNSQKHYFDQDPVVLQFWTEEMNKIKHGVNIGGYQMHPWLYFHLNFFRTPIPQPNGDEPNIQPDLRDNEWFFAENLKKCINPENENFYSKAMLMYGTRRFGKSVILASLAHWRTITKFNSFGSIIGGSSSDINALTSKIKTSMNFIDEPLRLQINKQEWDNGETTFGIKQDAQNPITFSTLIVQNLESGAKSKTQKTAGLAPSVSIYDEIGKYAFLKPYLAALPSFKTPYGFKCVTVLAGTGGEADLSRDAVDVLSNPEAYDLLPMDWDLLENHIDPEVITWKRRKFATYFPGQMAYETGFIKEPKPFTQFLGMADKELEKITIHTTNWKNNSELLKNTIEEARKVGGSKGKLLEQQKRVQYPIDPEDCFMSSEDNMFPGIEAQNRKNYLLETGDSGRKVFLTQNESGVIGYEMTNKELAEYPFAGGNIDAPCIMYEELPTEKPVDYLYLAGFDDYKQDTSSGDSVGSFFIYKANIGMDKWCGRIVFSLSTRPELHSKMYRQIFLAMQAYNAKLFMENADGGFKEYLDRKRITDLWLVESVDFKSDMVQKSNGNRKYGWTPTPANILFLKNLARKYMEQEHRRVNEDGKEEIILGVDLINDIGLLEEVISYKPDNNVDRITAFMSCLGYEYIAHQNYLLPSIDRMKKKKVEDTKPKPQRNLAQRMFGSNLSNKRLF